MRALIGIILLLSLCSCSSVGKGNIQGNAKDLNWALDGNQCAEVEFFESGQIKKAKIDNKSEPLISISEISPKYESNK